MLRIKRIVFSMALLIGLVISSCLEQGTNNGTAIAESTDIPSTVLENTLTSEPLPTETKSSTMSLPSIESQCVDTSEVTQKLDLSGVVAFEDKATQQDLGTGFFLWNLENGNTIKAIEESGFIQISPDQKYLAYRYTSSDGQSYLKILAGDGKTISDFLFHVDGRMQSFFNWQNVDHLRTLQQESDSKVTVHLLDPFAQEHTVLRTDWQDVYTPKNPFADKLVQWKFDERLTRIAHVYGANILYDPTLTRVLYPKDNSTVSLMNVESETELASAHFVDWGRLPSWSSDGQYLTILNREGQVDEIYLISRDGNEFQKITNFSSEFDLATIPEYSWSPDGRQIAFWLNTESWEQELGTQSELAVLDIASRQVTRLCIQGISIPAITPWTMNHPEPIWSPDGRYIMITQWDDPLNPQNYFVLIVDSLTGAVTRISENTAPIGWMISDP
jgi:hypothetical protein